MTQLALPRLRAFSVAALAIAASSLLTGTASAQTTPFKIDHFWCYVTTFNPANDRVQLQDQFDRAISPTFRESVVVRRPVRFCNPVSKLVEATGALTNIQNRESHLKIYRIHTDDDLAPVRKLRIQNQFGAKSIQTFDPIVLAAPTQKNNEGTPHDLDHFKCYRAYGGNINKLVTLRDQFQVQQQIRVLAPVIFCNPTEKIHATAGAPPVTTPITNREDHLICYAVTRRPFKNVIVARNQFGEEKLVLQDTDMLCVPTKKLKVSS